MLRRLFDNHELMLSLYSMLATLNMVAGVLKLPDPTSAFWFGLCVVWLSNLRMRWQISAEQRPVSSARDSTRHSR